MDLLKKGLKLSKENKYNESINCYKNAIKEFNNIIDKNKNNLKLKKEIKNHLCFLYTNIGTSYSYLKKDKESIPYFEKAYEIFPNNKIVVTNLAIIYEREFEYLKSSNFFKKLIPLTDESDENYEFYHLKEGECLLNHNLITEHSKAIVFDNYKETKNIKISHLKNTLNIKIK